MTISAKKLTNSLSKGDVRSLARTITLIESQCELGKECVELLSLRTRKSQIIGVTGAPGAGKSTLVDAITGELVNQGKKVAVLAVDPSSPFSGGALLGDRVRMRKAMCHQNVFIRSMATRGALGGIASSTWEVASALNAAGYDYIIVETVGVGQAEVEVVGGADICIVVLVPGMGDGIQALKAGILEIADIFVINKSDYVGADELFCELRAMLSLSKAAAFPTIVKTRAVTGLGVSELLSSIQEYQEWAKTNDVIKKSKIFKGSKAGMKKKLRSN